MPGSALSYASVPSEAPAQQEGLGIGSPKIAKGILLSIRVVNPDESSGQPSYAAQVPIHFSGGRVHTGPVIYGRDPCPEDHQHVQQLQSVQTVGYGPRVGRVYPGSYPNVLSASKSYTVGQQIQVAVPNSAKAFQYQGQTYNVPIQGVPAAASQEDTKSYVAYGGPGQGQQYQHSYQVAHAPSTAYQGGPVSPQSFGDGKAYTTYANGHAFQVVQQEADGNQQSYGGHGGRGPAGYGGPGGGPGGGHGGHGGQAVHKGYGSYAQDSYSVEASPPKSYGGGGSGGGNSIGAHQLSYEVSEAASGKGGYGGGGGGGGDYSGGPSYGGSGAYGKPSYQVNTYPAGQSSYSISPANFKSSGEDKSYGSYGGGNDGQTLIVQANEGSDYKGGDVSKSYSSYPNSGPSYGGSAATAYKPPQPYGGTAQQSYNRYTDPSSFYSGSPYAAANRLALLKYNNLMSRATSVLGGAPNFKSFSSGYNGGWNW